MKRTALLSMLVLAACGGKTIDFGFLDGGSPSRPTGPSASLGDASRDVDVAGPSDTGEGPVSADGGPTVHLLPAVPGVGSLVGSGPTDIWGASTEFAIPAVLMHTSITTGVWTNVPVPSPSNLYGYSIGSAGPSAVWLVTPATVLRIDVSGSAVDLTTQAPADFMIYNQTIQFAAAADGTSLFIIPGGHICEDLPSPSSTEIYFYDGSAFAALPTSNVAACGIAAANSTSDLWTWAVTDADYGSGAILHLSGASWQPPSSSPASALGTMVLPQPTDSAVVGFTQIASICPDWCQADGGDGLPSPSESSGLRWTTGASAIEQEPFGIPAPTNLDGSVRYEALTYAGARSTGRIEVLGGLLSENGAASCVLHEWDGSTLTQRPLGNWFDGNCASYPPLPTAILLDGTWLVMNGSDLAVVAW